jgi:ATP-dependent DNA helicase DinG
MMLSQRTRASPIRWVWRRLSTSFAKADAIPSVERILGPGGLLAARDKSYEHRQAQIDMARHVYNTLSADQQPVGSPLIIEAGTGVGKTLAYLIPAVLVQMSKRKQIGDKITVSYDSRMRLADSEEERKELEKAMEEEKSNISTKPIFVATNTKALQHQIMVKEKPLIEAMLGSEIKIVPAFGRQNYISKRLLNEAEDRTKKC